MGTYEIYIGMVVYIGLKTLAKYDFWSDIYYLGIWKVTGQNFKFLRLMLLLPSKRFAYGLEYGKIKVKL